MTDHNIRSLAHCLRILKYAPVCRYQKQKINIKLCYFYDYRLLLLLCYCIDVVNTKILQHTISRN